MTEYDASFHVDLGALQRTLQASIQRAVELVSFGLAASREGTVGPLELPGAVFQLKLAGDQTSDLERVRENFETWTLANGLRDCAESLNVFVDRCRDVCALYSFGPSASIPAEQWNQRVVEGGQSFRWMGLSKKLNHLEDDYDPKLRPTVSDDLLTISAARNCLVHRQGIVDDVDKNSGDGLLVSWVKPQLEIDSSEGRTELVPPVSVEAGSTIHFAQVKATKLFRVKDRIRFDAREFSELCWTFFRFGQELVRAVEDYGRARGIPSRQPREDGETKSAATDSD